MREVEKNGNKLHILRHYFKMCLEGRPGKLQNTYLPAHISNTDLQDSTNQAF